MSDLKTLKDFEIPEDPIIIKSGELASSGSGTVSLEDLKQEAIKWAKFRGKGEIQEWIKHFFNITEEELK